MSSSKRHFILLSATIFCFLFVHYSTTRTMRSRRSISEEDLNEIATSSTTFTDRNNCSKVNQSFCEEDEEGCLPSAVTKSWQLMVHAKNYKLSHCVILKDLSTIMMAIFCYLNDPKAFSAGNRTITTEYWKIRACKGKNEWTTIQPSVLNNSSWKHLAVIREPIERFLSGWVDKCYNNHAKLSSSRGHCYTCGQNLTCFIDQFYSKMRRFKAKIISRSFIMENHFWPQSWYCNFTHHLRDYTILKYDTQSKRTFYAEMAKIFVEQQVPSADIDEILRQGLTNSTSHTVSGKQTLERFRNELYGNRRLMRLLVKIFYNDYIMFNYPLPCV